MSSWGLDQRGHLRTSPAPAQLKSPNIFWPADRAWCVASEIDFDSTLVGGSEKLITTLVEDPPLGAWQARPADSLAFDADLVNS